MKNITLKLTFLFLNSLIFGQDVIKISGKVEMTANPCITEVCIPGLVWGLNVDTAMFILTKETYWIGDDPLMIYDSEYSDGDSIELYGQLFINQDWYGDNYYEFEIVDKELRDTVLNIENILTLVFDFPNFECGINIFEHPKHISTSELTYNGSLDTATYLYLPAQDFIGIDTIIFLTGCGVAPDYSYIKILEYLVEVTEETKINSITDKIFKIYPNPSSGLLHIGTDKNKGYWFTINNIQGQGVSNGLLSQDLTLTLGQGMYVISIYDHSELVHRQKIIIDK